MIVLRTLDGAWKCAFLAFLRLECRLELIFVMLAAIGGVVLLETVATQCQSEVGQIEEVRGSWREIRLTFRF